MGRGQGKIAVRFSIGFAVAVLLAVSSAAAAADYSRRIAIAPFTILGPQEEIRTTVDILPRLLSSRLMALAGAEVILLPPGDRPPEEAARGAGLPLLLKGSVAKLGAGYSIDVTVTEPPTGKMAGAFFASAATEDEIILRLGDLAAEISEKLFGVKSAVRTYPSPAAAQPPGPPPSVPPPTAAAAPPQAAALPTPVSVPAPAAPTTPKEGWVPSSLTKVGQSDKIADEVYGVVAGDVDAEGNGEVIAWGKNVLYFYRVKGVEILPFTRITKERKYHILSVEAADIDGDGGKELLVTSLAGEALQSFVLKKKGDVYQEVAEGMPYFLVVLRNWHGNQVIVGQRAGFDLPFRGKLVTMTWDGKALGEGEPLPANTDIKPLHAGILGLSSAKFGDEWKLIYTDEEDYLRTLDETGKTEYKTRNKYGSGIDLFEWGPYLPREGKRMETFLRKAARVSDGQEGKPLVLITEVDKIFLNVARFYDSTRLVLLQWEDGEFGERAGTKKSNHFYSGTDYLSPSGIRKGGEVVASVIEQEGSVSKEKVSRLVLYRVE